MAGLDGLSVSSSCNDSMSLWFYDPISNPLFSGVSGTKHRAKARPKYLFSALLRPRLDLAGAFLQTLQMQCSLWKHIIYYKHNENKLGQTETAINTEIEQASQ